MYQVSVPLIRVARFFIFKLLQLCPVSKSLCKMLHHAVVPLSYLHTWRDRLNGTFLQPLPNLNAPNFVNLIESRTEIWVCDDTKLTHQIRYCITINIWEEIFFSKFLKSNLIFLSNFALSSIEKFQNLHM